MHTVSSRELQRRIGHYQDLALVKPVAITSLDSHGSLVT
jgi:hypothetical protein